MQITAVNITDTARPLLLDGSPAELARIEDTVRAPDRVELCPAGASVGDAAAVLVAKRQDGRLMLVGGRLKPTLAFDVHDVLCIDETAIGVTEADSLVQILARFADRYGLDLTVGATRERFFRHAHLKGDPQRARHRVVEQIPGGREFHMSCYLRQTATGIEFVNLFAFDTVRYKSEARV